jgi:hypothetical protein
MTRKFLMIAAVAMVALTSSLSVGTAEARWWGGYGWHGYWHGYYGWRGGWGPRFYYAYWGPRYYGYWGPHYYYRCGC